MKYIQSENYLCFVTLLEMILNDIGIHKYSRYDIAEELGITLPLNTKGVVRNANYSDDACEWGVKVDSEKLNIFFNKHGISLHAEYIHVTSDTMLEKEVGKWSQCYVIFLFSYGELVGNLKLQEVGHAALFVDMPDPEKVRIYDPGPKESGEKNIDCYRMEEAMYQRHAGYVLIQKI